MRAFFTLLKNCIDYFHEHNVTSRKIFVFPGHSIEKTSFDNDSKPMLSNQ